VFNCDGSATSTVTVTNSGSTPKFSYDYFMDGVNNAVPMQMYLKATQGDHTVTVNYNVLSVQLIAFCLRRFQVKGGLPQLQIINQLIALRMKQHLTTPGWTCDGTNKEL
jgi:hypothetical protein